MTRILIVTDQPFWRRNNGAHQRTWSLLEYLRGRGFQVSVWFMVDRTEQDRTCCDELALEIFDFSPPVEAGWFPRLPRVRFGRRRSDTRVQPALPASPRPLTLGSYAWPNANERFRQLVSQIHPRFVMSEYVVWSGLLDAFEAECRPFRAIVDTHDLLHARRQQFDEHGHQHWLEISREEEADAVAKFDLILATQPEEAQEFRSMAPGSDVVVAGHAHVGTTIRADPPHHQPRQDQATRFGFIGSSNAANAEGIQWFLDHCWPKIHRDRPVELRVAGTVEQQLRARSSTADTTICGPVDSIEDFYKDVDVVINPVRFGSGIKIKTVEALSYGKPVVAHPHTTPGIPAAATECTLVAETADDFVSACCRLVDQEHLRSRMVQQALRVGTTELSTENVYRAFGQWLDENR